MKRWLVVRWFGHVWRGLVEAPVSRVELMEGSQNARGKGKQRKSIGETINKDLEVNSLSIDMIYD